jgi:hypothetical protein
MPPEGNLDPLQRLQQRLYASQAPSQASDESLHARAPQVADPRAEQWAIVDKKLPKKGISWTVWFFIAATVFFFITVGVVFLFLAQGGRSVSNDNLNITIQGPTTIASGTTVPIVVSIQNRNPANITNANLSIAFPDGTRSSDDITQPLVRYEGEIGTVVAGGTITRTVQAVLFGSVNQTVTIPVTLVYGTQDSNASFTKTVNYTFTITSSPLTVTAQSVASVSSGQPFTIAVAVRSNATTPLENVAVSAQYPNGFVATQSGIASTSGNTYIIGTLQPGQEKDFTVSGSLAGTDNNQQDFQFIVGTLKDSTSNTLNVAYASADSKLTIQKPFLQTSLSLNNQTTDPTTISAGQQVAGTVSWTNTLADPITNAQIVVKLSGAALDPTTVHVTNGFYSSSANSIVFNGQTEASLSNLSPGDTGNGSFFFGTKSVKALAGATNPTVQLAVSVSGRVNGASQVLTNTLTKHVQLSSSVGLTSKILHSIGPFQNTGPWPPKVGNTTTYTVQFAIVNTVNPVAGAVVTAILPPYVTYVGQVNPADGSITYDSNTHKVTWKAGAIAAGIGISSAADTASFQISYTPSITQVNLSPVLVESQELIATDRTTQTSIDTTAAALTTEAQSDPGYQSTFGNVSN